MQRRCGAAIVALGFFAASRADAQSPAAAPDTIAVGDWQLAPALQLRTRGEYRRDPLDMGGRDETGRVVRVRDAWLVFERARVGLGAERGALRAQVTLQDARAWGTRDAFGFFEPLEAYAEARTSAARPSYLRVGRQVVSWGEGRLLGAADWHPVTRSLDALRGKLALGPFDLEVLAALLDAPQPSSPSFGASSGPSSSGTQLYGAQVAWPIDPLLRIEIVSLARIARGAGIGTRFLAASSAGETIASSLRVSGEGRGWKYGVEGAYEFGNASSLAPGGIARSAWAAAGHVARGFDTLVLSPTLRLGGSLATGDAVGSDKYRQFDPILPDVHTHYGLMDVLAWSNVVEGNARLTVVPWTDTSFAFEYRYAHLFEASGEWLNGYLAHVGRGGREGALGHELDFVFTWRPWTPLDLSAGYSAFLLGDGARTVMAAEGRGALQADGTFSPAAVSHFGYLQATVNVP